MVSLTHSPTTRKNSTRSSSTFKLLDWERSQLTVCRIVKHLVEKDDADGYFAKAMTEIYESAETIRGTSTPT